MEVRRKFDRPCQPQHKVCKYNKRVVRQWVQQASPKTERMWSCILACTGSRTKQIEAPIVGKIPPVGIQRIDQCREQPTRERSASFSSLSWRRGNTPEAEELVFAMPLFVANLSTSLCDKV